MAEGDDWPVLDRTSLDAIAALVERCLPEERLAVDELAASLFVEDQPAVVRGDPEVGVVASVLSLDDGGQGFVRLLAVDPSCRRKGIGSSLLDAAERDVVSRGAARIALGADAPYYLFAGVPTEQTAMQCLAERLRYQRAETNFNMTVTLDDLPPRSGETEIAEAGDRADIESFMTANYAGWTKEVLRALGKGTLVISRDDDGAVLGFCAFDVNRRGLVGPVGVRLDRIGRGLGFPLLVDALHHLRDGGAASVDVSWVGPIRPYAAVGGTVTRTFFVYRKELSR